MFERPRVGAGHILSLELSCLQIHRMRQVRIVVREGQCIRQRVARHITGSVVVVARMCCCNMLRRTAYTGLTRQHAQLLHQAHMPSACYSHSRLPGSRCATLRRVVAQGVSSSQAPLVQHEQVHQRKRAYGSRTTNARICSDPVCLLLNMLDCVRLVSGITMARAAQDGHADSKRRRFAVSQQD